MKLPATVESFEAVHLGKASLHLAIGMFDGVHLGHRSVIESALHSARRSGGVAAVLTFWPHPSHILHPESPTLQLMLPEIKARILHELGVDLLIRKKFSRRFAALPAEAFVSFLRRALPGLSALYVGEDFRFGRDRKGDVALLIREAQKAGLNVFSAERIKRNGKAISSTRIRMALREGRIEEANALLGYTYFSTGKILEGRKIGRTIGFPTINLSWVPELKPKFGVYAVEVSSPRGDENRPGVANYGLKPTLSDNAIPLLEVHLLDPTNLNPGDETTIKWRAFIRPEKKFSNLDALKEQISIDREKVLPLLVRK